MSRKTVGGVLASAHQTLNTARLGLADAASQNPQRRLARIRNMVVFGRAVTNVIQNLRSIAPNFEDWYGPWRNEMEAEPLLRYFYKLRSQILKQGTGPRFNVSTHMNSFSTSDVGKGPPGATSFFIGDQIGGSGWIIPQPDGTELKYYIDPPADRVTTSLELPDAPTSFLDQPIPDRYVVSLGELYLT